MARIDNFSITDKGVIFSNVTPNGADGGALTAAGNYTNETEQQTISKFVNCVDIDWNGAEIPTSEVSKPSSINTTGDLINTVKWASQQGNGYHHPMYDNVYTQNETLMKIKVNSLGHIIERDIIDDNPFSSLFQSGDGINVEQNNGKIKFSYYNV